MRSHKRKIINSHDRNSSGGYQNSEIECKKCQSAEDKILLVQSVDDKSSIIFVYHFVHWYFPNFVNCS